MDCNEAKPLLAGHALGALDASEKAVLEHHLHSCRDCRDELEEDRQTVGRLPLVVGLSEPPPSLKTHLMARLERLQETQGVHSVTQRKPWRSILTSRPAIAVAASFTVILFAVLAWALYGDVRERSLDRRSTELSATVKSLETQNARLADAVQAQWGMISMAADRRVASAAVTPSDASPRTWGTVLVNKERQQAAVMVAGLEPPQQGEVYQVWVWDTGARTMVPVGQLRILADGYGYLWFQSPLAFSGGAIGLGASREPEPGSSVPTSPMLFTARSPTGE